MTSAPGPPTEHPRRRGFGPWVALAAGLAVVVVLGAVLLRDGGGGETGTDGAEPASGTVFPWERSPPPPSLVPLEEIVSGGPPPDGIPPIDEPAFVPAGEADEWLSDREPVISLVHEGVARAYPLQVLTWHEIANDVVAGDPITVTFCPLCNSAIAFDRRVRTTDDAAALLDGSDEAVLDFGTSGRLYRSNLVMYDRQTKSLWIQFTGRSVTGPFMGTELRNVPVQIVSWGDFRAAFPDADVLSRDTGHSRKYGTNPYVGYDDAASSPFLYDGPTDDRLRPMDRVVAVHADPQAIAYRFEDLRSLTEGAGGAAAVHGELDGEPHVVLFRRGTASALDSDDIASSRDVGATGVFRPSSGPRELHFEARAGRFMDAETGERLEPPG